MRILASLVLALVSIAAAIDPAPSLPSSSSSSSPSLGSRAGAGGGPHVGTAKTYPLKAFPSSPNPAKRGLLTKRELQIQASSTTLVCVKEFSKRAGGGTPPPPQPATVQQPDSAGFAVDGYGHDLSYYVQIQLGSAAQNQRQSIQKVYNLLVDTGSFYTWVYGPTCTAQQCLAHNRFDPSTSSTFAAGSAGGNSDGQNDQSTAFAITYGSGSVTGSIVNDSLALAGFKCPQKFGLAEAVDDHFAAFAPFDGMLGLPAADKSPAEFPGVVSTLAQQGLIARRVFSVSLGKSTDATDEGSLTIGGVDSSKYSGEVVYLPTVQGKDSAVAGNSNRALLWEILVSGFYLDGFAVDFGPETRTAIVDTGTTLLIMTPADALKFHSYIEFSRTDGSNFVVPCNTSMQVELEFNGARFKVAPEDYVGVPYTGGGGSGGADFCISNVQGIQFETNQWILGTVFLKNVYTVFDMDARQVGFANKVGGPTAETKPDSYIVSYDSTAITPTQPPSLLPPSSGSGAAASPLPVAPPTDTAWSYHSHSHSLSDQLLGGVPTSPAELSAIITPNATTESFYPPPLPPSPASTPPSTGGGDSALPVIKPSSAPAAPALWAGRSSVGWSVSGWLALLFFIGL